MGTTTDYDELSYYWTAWRNETGPQMLPSYPEYVRLTNKAATNRAYSDRFEDGSEMWLEPYAEEELNYTSVDFQNEIKDIWGQLEDSYKLLHGFVRSKLMENEDYEQHFNEDLLIPANILGTSSAMFPEL